MMTEIFLGDTCLHFSESAVGGGFVEIENERFYKISNYHRMSHFFMTVVSHSDHWMFLSSNGSLSAGRKNKDNAIFPYYTVDKIHDYRNLSGSKTYCLAERNKKKYLWEPFTEESEKMYRVERNLYKNISGNKVIFEEINQDLEVKFQYGWYNSEKFGWIKKSQLVNLSRNPLKIEVLDGLRNILPYGIDADFQNAYSNLADAYKKNELLEKSKLGLFLLSSIPVDRAEPSEALKATTVWLAGLDNAPKILISDKQIEAFKQGKSLVNETDIRASRGAYYVNSEFKLNKDVPQEWYFVIEVNQDAVDVANLDHFIKTTANKSDILKKDIEKGTEDLVKIVAGSDGLQKSNEELASARHFSNTLYNIMRGGIFANSYSIDSSDLLPFVANSNARVANRFKTQLKEIPHHIPYQSLIQWAEKVSDPDLKRIISEYLPLTFSRRHGDPSRPWNQFSIETRNSDGSKKLSYEGNWRDIFQNWEALLISFPEYTEGIIGKFLNASTADGYNPYRITRDGIDWEKSDPEDPWSYIGYWGDHQIIYLQKLLEQSNRFHPEKLDRLLAEELFVYANVPYRIKSFDEIRKNPKDTITFDHLLDKEIDKRFTEIGADGKLLLNDKLEAIKANLIEKILVTLLAKLSNFIPEAGIWLNTQRPEWNDANNALVGNGVSMVTLYYLRRFLQFWKMKLTDSETEEVDVAEEIKLHFDRTNSVFIENAHLLQQGFSDEDRYKIARKLGEAGTEYRNQIYKHSFSCRRVKLSIQEIVEFLEQGLAYIDQSIQKNRRKDGLYHAYNLISIKEDGISIRYLYEMLEGQVAVLSSGYLTPTEGLQVLDALKSSSIFREDQFSYMLYPNRQLPRFTEKNNIPEKSIAQSDLLKKLIEKKDTSIVIEDETGGVHFNGSFRNASVLKEALMNLTTEGISPTENEIAGILEIYEELFDHQSFTGRSGTFYGYEGLGSIYWHMVSKLLLAVQENFLEAVNQECDATTVGRLKDHYYEIKAGIGLYKSPDIYGAFPTDAYSHTPGNAGVKQPGLTGQVKEDVISRFGELGLAVNNGQICFDTSLLNANEWLNEDIPFEFYNVKGEKEVLEVEAGQLAYTFCQIPVVYSQHKKSKTIIICREGVKKELSGNVIPIEESIKIFNRTGDVKRIDFYTP